MLSPQILFGAGTVFFLYVSRKSLLNVRSHGFYRFFVFESIWALCLLNQPYWFAHPFSIIHIFSWILLFTSICFVLQSLLMLKKQGGYGERKEMPENHSFENTVHVVENGLYHYIRHPMYSSLLFLGWGAFLKQITPLTTLLVLLVSVFLVAAAKVEEDENIHFFGDRYRSYMKRSKMFIPWLI